MHTTNPFEGFIYNALKPTNELNTRPSYHHDPFASPEVDIMIERRRGVTVLTSVTRMPSSVPMDIPRTEHDEYIATHAFSKCTRKLTEKPMFKFAVTNQIPFTIIPTQDWGAMQYTLEYVIYPNADEIKEWNELCVVNKLQSDNYSDYKPIL